MLVVISPAKKLNYDPLDGNIGATLPAFQSRANELAKVANKLSVSELRSLMKISENLAVLNKARFKAFASVSDTQNAKQAAFAFAGDTYMGLQATDFDAADLEYAQDHLRILSGLYGALKPLDLIQPYRLEMGSRLKTDQAANLYGYWGRDIGCALDEVANGVVVNCASSEYFKATGKEMTARVITPVFKEQREDGLKMIGFYAKKARGSMARFMVQNRIDNPEGLKDFNTDGYGFQASLSEADTWVFTRKAT